LQPRNAFGLDVIFQSFSHFFGDKDHLGSFAALGIFNCQFLIVKIHSSEVQYFPNPHTSPCHEFQDKPISHLSGPKDNLVNGIFIYDRPLCQLLWTEKLFQHRCVAGIMELGIQIIADEIKKGFYDGIPGMLG
jgi:hypothetical protein